MSLWAATRVAAEFCRAEIERRFAPKKLEVEIDRFEVNPGKSQDAAGLGERIASRCKVQ
jgi:hypothetical protein